MRWSNQSGPSGAPPEVESPEPFPSQCSAPAPGSPSLAAGRIAAEQLPPAIAPGTLAPEIGTGALGRVQGRRLLCVWCIVC